MRLGAPFSRTDSPTTPTPLRSPGAASEFHLSSARDPLPVEAAGAGRSNPAHPPLSAPVRINQRGEREHLTHDGWIAVGPQSPPAPERC